MVWRALAAFVEQTVMSRVPLKLERLMTDCSALYGQFASAKGANQAAAGICQLLRPLLMKPWMPYAPCAGNNCAVLGWAEPVCAGQTATTMGLTGCRGLEEAGQRASTCTGWAIAMGLCGCVEAGSDPSSVGTL